MFLRRMREGKEGVKTVTSWAHLSRDVVAADDALSVEAASFVGARRRVSPVVATDAATSVVLQPLRCGQRQVGRLHSADTAQGRHSLTIEAAAEELVVVVVDGRQVAEAPHGVPGRRVHEAGVSVGQRLERRLKTSANLYGAFRNCHSFYVTKERY